MLFTSGSCEVDWSDPETGGTCTCWENEKTERNNTAAMMLRNMRVNLLPIPLAFQIVGENLEADFVIPSGQPTPYAVTLDIEWARDISTTIAIVHNVSVPNHSDDPPESFAIAKQRFKTFLVENDYPQRVKWIFAEDVVIGKQHKYWVRQRLGDELEEATLRYAEGVAKGLGVELRAVCATAEETFATVYVPKDLIDAEYHLIGRCLKLSCPVEKPTARKVTNRLKWFFLLKRDRGRSRCSLE